MKRQQPRPEPVEDEPFRLIPEPETARVIVPALPGKDELNLAEFPIALVTDRIPAGQKTLRFEDRYHDEHKGQLITRRLVITASDEYGLPTAKDDEVILGLIQLTQKSNGFETRTVDFNRAELVRLLRWPDTGPSYRRLTLSLQRWLGVSLYYENAWWDHRQKRWTSLGFHILDDLLMVDGGRATGPREEPALSRFTWNQNVFRNFDSGHLKQLDLDFYFGLVHPTAKRMYRFLDKRFHQREEVTLEIKELAFDHIGMSRSYEGATQLVRKLRPAIEELEAKHFLTPMTTAERYRKESPRRWTVVFRRNGSTAKKALPVDQGAGPDAPASENQPCPDGLAVELTSRGVTSAVAEEIVRDFPDERLRHHLDVHDWLLSRRDPRVMRNPAGFLVQSVRRDYAAPKGYVSEEEQARRADANRHHIDQQASGRSRRDEQRRREAAEIERVWAHWEALPACEQEQVWSQCLAATVPFLAEQFRRHQGRSPELERRYRRLILEGHLRDQLATEESTPAVE